MSHESLRDAVEEAKSMLEGDGVAHIFGSPDDELRSDECTCDAERGGAKIIFHVDAYVHRPVMSEEFSVCFVCGESSRHEGEA